MQRRYWKQRDGSVIFFGRDNGQEARGTSPSMMVLALDDGTLVSTHDVAVYFYCQGRLTDRPAVSWLHDLETLELPK